MTSLWILSLFGCSWSNCRSDTYIFHHNCYKLYFHVCKLITEQNWMNIHEQISTSIKFCQSLFAWYSKTTSKPEIKTKEKNSNKNVDKRKKRREKKKKMYLMKIFSIYCLQSNYPQWERGNWLKYSNDQPSKGGRRVARHIIVANKYSTQLIYILNERNQTLS